MFLYYSCFGKICEDLKCRRERIFITNSERAKKELSSPLYESCQLIKEGLLQVIIKHIKIKIKNPNNIFLILG